MSDNLRIWNAVRSVDPANTKPIVGKPYKGTTVRFQALVKMATEQWGPCGAGWGWSIDDERIEDLGGGEKLHIARVTLWYMHDGQRAEVPHVGQTYLVQSGKNGLRSDEDAPKKSVTDALTKALSCVGFAADIYMGLWDDARHVDEVRRDYAEKARDTAAKAKNPTTTDRDADEERWRAWVEKEALGFGGKDRQFLEDWKEANAKYTNKLARAFPDLSARLWTAFDLALDDAVASGRQGFTDLTAAG